MSKMPTWAVVLTSLGGCGCVSVLLVGGLGYFGLQKGKEILTKTAAQSANDGRLLKLEGAKLVNDSGQRSIVGTLRNPTNQTFFTAAISFELKDKSGKTVGSTRTFSEKNIAPNSVWKFEAPVDEENVSTFVPGTVNAFLYKSEYDSMSSDKLMKLRFQLGGIELSKINDLLSGKKVELGDKK